MKQQELEIVEDQEESSSPVEKKAEEEFMQAEEDGSDQPSETTLANGGEQTQNTQQIGEHDTQPADESLILNDTIANISAIELVNNGGINSPDDEILR